MNTTWESEFAKIIKREYPGESFDVAEVWRKSRFSLLAAPMETVAHVILEPLRLQLIWNWLAVPLFGVTAFTFWQAMAGVILIRLAWAPVMGQKITKAHAAEMMRQPFKTIVTEKVARWAHFLWPIAVAYWLRGMI